MAQNHGDAPQAALATTNPDQQMTRQERAFTALEPRGFDQAMQVAEMVAKGRLFDVASKEEAFIRMATGASLGIPPIQALRCIFVVKNQPVISAAMKVALCLSSPHCERFELESCDNDKATYVVKRKGRQEKRFTYGIEDAVRAGYLKPGGKEGKDNYVHHPAAMFRARASSMAADIEFPDVTKGLTSQEDMEAERDRTATVVQAELVSEPPKSIELLKQIRAASCKNDLDGALFAVQQAHKAGDISDSELASLKSEHTGQKQILIERKKAKDAESKKDAPAAEAAVPPTPPSGDVVTTPAGMVHTADGEVLKDAKG